jgi:polysaccharide biosynthesis transport protein
MPSESPLGSDQAHAGWRRPRVEAGGLQRYLQIVRERRWMIFATVAATMLAAVAYLAVAGKTYKSEADLLVTPVSDSDTALTGLGLIRESSDPTRDIETGARLVTTRDVAERARRILRTSESARSLLKRVDAAPIAQSSLVAITAKASTAARSRDIANAFAAGAVGERTAVLHREIDSQLPALRRRALGTSGPDSPASQLAQYESLRNAPDPTIRVETRAATPDSPSWPRPMLTLLAAFLAGLVLGVGGAFAMHSIDPRLRREGQLRELYGLPILARIPTERKGRTYAHGRRRFVIGPRTRRRKALAPGQLSPSTLEAFRTLRAMLDVSRAHTSESRSVLVTGPSPSEGKTTTAINLASSLALAGNRVILVEADFRRPTVAEALGVRPRVGIGRVLLGNTSLEEALVPTKPFGGNLRALLVDRADDWLAEVLSLPTAGGLLKEAERLADYVVIDSPPLTEVIDALPLAQQADDVLLVVRLGFSNLAALGRLGDLLEQHAIVPNGFVLVGVGSSQEPSYYLKPGEGEPRDDFPLASAERPRRRARAGSAEV